MAEDARKLRGWILENAGLEAKSLPIAIWILWMMDRERWEAYQREQTKNNLEEVLELVLRNLEAAITTAAQVAGPPAVECLLSPCPPAEGECLLVLPPQPKWEEPERPQPKWEEPEHPQPKWEEPERPQPKQEEPERPTPEQEEPESWIIVIKLCELLFCLCHSVVIPIPNLLILFNSGGLRTLTGCHCVAATIPYKMQRNRSPSFI
ncbi:UNVERIFIED_CONTAM: hypothetical protein FKN15_077402 [Acipenser sinensis]